MAITCMVLGLVERFTTGRVFELIRLSGKSVDHRDAISALPRQGPWGRSRIAIERAGLPMRSRSDDRPRVQPPSLSYEIRSHATHSRKRQSRGACNGRGRAETTARAGARRLLRLGDGVLWTRSRRRRGGAADRVSHSAGWTCALRREVDLPHLAVRRDSSHGRVGAAQGVAARTAAETRSRWIKAGSSYAAGRGARSRLAPR